MTKAIYRRVPVLVKEGPPEENPWGIRFATMFYMSNDSHLFRTREQLEADGWRLEGNVFVKAEGSREVGSREIGAEERGERYLPLYEAKMFHHYDHRWATYANGVTRDLTLVEKNDPACVVLPRYWVSETETINRLTQVSPDLLNGYILKDKAKVSQALEMWLGSYWENRGNPAIADWAFDRYLKRIGLGATMLDTLEAAVGRQHIGNLEERYPLTEADLELVMRHADDGVLKIAEALIQAKTPKWLIGFRDVCRSTDERTSIFSIMSRTGVGHKAPLILAHGPLSVAMAVGPYTALVFDYVTRQGVGGTSLSYFILKQLPVIAPELYAKPCPWAGALPVSAHTALSAWLMPRVLELTYTAWNLEPFARDCGYGGPPFRWDEERRFLLRCELDAAYFHLYGIARDDVAYILDTFPIVKRKDLAAHGEYRTQRVILEIYDAMAEAMHSGVPYPTRLDPPPADPRVAHPPKGAVKSPGELWRLSDIVRQPIPARPFTLELSAEDAPQRQAGRYRCTPLDGGAPAPDEGTLVLVRHPNLTRGGRSVPAAVGTWQVQELVDAATRKPVYKVFLRGPMPPAELRLTPDEWAAFRPVGVLTRLDE